MTYYAQRKSVNNGEAQPIVNKYGTQAEMEYQFHLFCASAVKTDVRDLDSIEWELSRAEQSSARYMQSLLPNPKR